MGHSGCMAELTYVGSLNSETWLNISGFTDFRPVLFVTKYHTDNSSQIYHLCHLLFWQYSFSRHLKFMTTGEDRNKDQFENWKLCVLLKLPFCHHRAINLTQNCASSPVPVLTPLVRLPSLVYATPRYSNVSTCCSILPLTCSKLPWASWETQHLNLFTAGFRYPRQHRTPTTPQAFHEERDLALSPGRQNICIRLWHAPRISRKFGGDCTLVCHAPAIRFEYSHHIG